MPILEIPNEGPWASKLFADLQQQFLTPCCVCILARLGIFVHNEGFYIVSFLYPRRQRVKVLPPPTQRG